MRQTIILALSTLLAALLAAFPLAAVEMHTVDVAHSDVSFEIRHLLSRVRGEFNEFDGTIRFDRESPEASTVTFVIAAESIDTDVPDRDQHLRSEDFFHVAEHPEIRFESSAVEPLGDDTFRVTGTLAMRGVERPAELEVRYLGQVTDPWGNVKAGFATSTTLDRKEYGIVWNKALDSGGFILGDEVEVSIDLQTVVAPEEVAGGAEG